MFASGSSFMSSLVRRVPQNVTVITSQLISRECAEKVLHSALLLLLNVFPLQDSFFSLSDYQHHAMSLITF